MRSDGRVPDGWRVVRLGEVAEVITGGTPPRENREYYGGCTPWVKLSHLAKNHFVSRSDEYLTKKGESISKLVPKGSVLVSCIGTIGQVAIAGVPLCFNQQINALRPYPFRVTPSFLYWSCLARAEYMKAIAPKTAVPILNKQEFSRILILLPPLPEQRAIAGVLDAIDEAIERTEAVIEATERLRDSLLHELLTRGVPGWHSGWKEVAGVGMVPACWEVVRLGEVAEVQTGRAVNRKSAKHWDVEIPYLSVANVKDGYLDLSAVKTMRVSTSEIDRYRLRQGDVLFTEGGDADKLGRGTVWQGEIKQCLHQNHVFAVRTRNSALQPEFLAAYAASGSGKRFFLNAAKQTTNLASVNATQLRQMPIPVPDIREQAKVDGLLSAAGRLNTQARVEREALAQLKTSTADALLTGRLRTKER